jgi:hypothetical protein
MLSSSALLAVLLVLPLLWGGRHPLAVGLAGLATTAGVVLWAVSFRRAVAAPAEVRLPPAAVLLLLLLAALGLVVSLAEGADASAAFAVLSLAPGAVLHSQESFGPETGEQSVQEGDDGVQSENSIDSGAGALPAQNGEGMTEPSAPSLSGSGAWGVFNGPVFVTGEESFAGDALNGKP